MVISDKLSLWIKVYDSLNYVFEQTKAKKFVVYAPITYVQNSFYIFGSLNYDDVIGDYYELKTIGRMAYTDLNVKFLPDCSS